MFKTKQNSILCNAPTPPPPSGVDIARGVFLVHDPAKIQPHLPIPVADVEEARRAFGTDEDILIIPLPA